MYPETNVAQPQQDLFTEEDLLTQYEEASTGQRFLNLLIDSIFMRFTISYLTSQYISEFAAEHWTRFYIKAILDQGVEYYMLLMLIGYVNYLIYYTFCEWVFKGVTLGKLVTGTRAVREDGTEIGFKEAILRTLSRIVPFEQFSGFGTPWHDTWTRTTVIKVR
jgi:uncharacterized RDD family membrane protein YckC